MSEKYEGTATYFDKSGNARTGYIVNGRTYKDPDGTIRIDDGTLVNTADGKWWYLAGESSGEVDPSSALDIVAVARARSDYENALTDSRNAARAGIEAATERQAAALEGKRGEINESYDDLARQAYVNYRLGEKENETMLARAGLTATGTAETVRSGERAQYENALVETEKGRRSAVAELENAIRDIRLSGDEQLAEAMAQTALARVNEAYDGYLRAVGAKDENEKLREQREYDRLALEEKREYERLTEQEKREYEEKQAQLEYERSRELALLKKSGSGTKKSSGETTKPSAQLVEWAWDQIYGGNSNDYIASVIGVSPVQAQYMAYTYAHALDGLED